MFDFMKYLLVEESKIKKFIENNFDKHYYCTNVESIMETGNCREICEMLPCSEVSMYNMVEYIKDKGNDKDIKNVILESFMRNIPNICYSPFCICPYSKQYITNANLLSFLRILKLEEKKITGEEADNKLLSLTIDGNEVELINVTYANGFHNVTESIMNFTKQYLLKFIEQ